MAALIKNKKILFSSIIAFLIIVLGSSYYWFLGTPQYSMMKLKSAIESHDADKAMTYIDIDAIFDSLWAKMQSKALSELEKSKDTEDGFAAFGATLGMSFLENMKPGIKEMIKTTFKDSIASSDPKEAEKQKLRTTLTHDFKFKRNGNSATVEAGDNVKLILKQGDKRIWRIVGIEGMEDLVSEPKK